MKSDLRHSIELGQGLGDIKFGFSAREVQAYLGAPDETEIPEQDDGAVVMWIYKAVGLRIVFQRGVFEAAESGDDPPRVTQFATSYPAATLWGTNIMWKTEPQVLRLFGQHGHGASAGWEAGDPSPETGEKLLRLESMGVVMAFQNGLLQSVHWAVVPGN